MAELRLLWWRSSERGVLSADFWARTSERGVLSAEFWRRSSERGVLSAEFRFPPRWRTSADLAEFWAQNSAKWRTSAFIKIWRSVYFVIISVFNSVIDITIKTTIFINLIKFAVSLFWCVKRRSELFMPSDQYNISDTVIWIFPNNCNWNFIHFYS